jgi:ornithine cyclodeaminase/alanine dehydrogenase-like protein (mu-crystallin family)
MTLFLDRDQIVKLLTIDDCIDAVEHVFRDGGEATSIGLGHFHVKAAIVGNRFAVKMNGNFPGNPERYGLPTIQGLIILADAERGTPLAVLDSISITAMRTAAASAVAAKYLAIQDARTITIVGCGTQASAQLEAMRRVRPIEQVFAVDVDRAKAEALGEVRPLEEAVRESDIVITCTTSTTPFLRREHLHPGLFIAAVGADNPRKSELAPELMANAKVVADVLEQAATMGDLHHALEAGVMTREDVFGELADVIRGRGRTSDDEVFVFDSTGTALQDGAVASIAYERHAGQALSLSATT